MNDSPFRTARIAALAVTCVSGVALASPHGEGREAGGFGAETGEALYASVCQGCHMENGAGAERVGHYPALAGNPAVASDVYVMQMTLYGNRGMPGFGGFLDDAQVAEVVNYVRGELGGNDYPGELSADDVAQARDPSRTDPLE